MEAPFEMDSHSALSFSPFFPEVLVFFSYYMCAVASAVTALMGFVCKLSVEGLGNRKRGEMEYNVGGSSL